MLKETSFVHFLSKINILSLIRPSEMSSKTQITRNLVKKETIDHKFLHHIPDSINVNMFLG